MRRLPMFIKAELKFCHSCRILKTRCNCFDYSQLESSYQERDQALRYAALRAFPVERDESMGESAAGAVSPATDPGVRTPLSNASTTPAMTSPGDQAALVSQSRQFPRFDFNSTVARVTTPSSSSAHAQQEHPTPSTTSASAPGPAPTLVKFELHTIIIAKEKIGTQSRRWQCRFGLTDNPADPVCKREDENMETIRRHYGREHGTHRYHRRPTLRIRCSHCDHAYDNQRPPTKCPRCKVDRGLWLREIYAIVEVPVPLDNHDQDDGIAAGNSDNGNPGNGTGQSGPQGPRVDANNSHGGHRSDNAYGGSVPIDPDTNMPECYNDICNNTTALPVMPPPSVTGNTSGLYLRPSSSSTSSSTMQSQAASPFTQGFYTLSHGLHMLPLARMAYPSPPSPLSIASSGTYDVEATTLFAPYDRLHVASAPHQAHLVDRAMVNGTGTGTVLFGGPVGGGVANISASISAVGVAGAVDEGLGVSDEGAGAGAGNQVVSYTDMLNADAGAPPLTHPAPATMADVQAYMEFAARQEAHASASAPASAPSTTEDVPMGKCATEVGYFDFDY
ncbi:hypothetical protein SCUCBS95973_009178 [Sporothrix curviconia]|uniref:Uncharacterized protein n=1 Tax=Sporothrix curviconia TaxID=1260050 RepID=A0ABP0CVF7_9PEZI